MTFQRALLAWYDRHRRPLPWRESNDFYRVWISEIMLQQTRVEAVIPYYERFLARFPGVAELAAADEPDVLAAWSGLGYYSRARNLHRTAKQIQEEGEPRTCDQILGLAGIGPYTAAAIASIVFDLPRAAVDGNVMRVISRLYNDAGDIGSPATRRRFEKIAGELLDPRRPGDFNQAMMELGATVCTPKSPECGRCPVAKLCEGRAQGTAAQLPVKLRKQQSRDLRLDIVLRRDRDRILLVRRATSERRMAGFWELPEKRHYPGLRGRAAAEFRHQIVGDRFQVRVWTTRSNHIQDPAEGRWVAIDQIPGLPLSTIARKALAATVDYNSH